MNTIFLLHLHRITVIQTTSTSGFIHPHMKSGDSKQINTPSNHGWSLEQFPRGVINCLYILAPLAATKAIHVNSHFNPAVVCEL